MKIKFCSTILLIAYLTISCEKEVSVSPRQKYDEGTGKYYVSTEPQGAAIYINDRNTGLFSPDTVKWLQEGSLNFTLKREPYIDHHFADNIENGQQKMIEYSFFSNPKNYGSITFNSSPGSCSVFLNDSLMNFKTPYSLGGLITDHYIIKYTYPEHRAGVREVFLKPGDNLFQNIILTDTTVWVTYNEHNSGLVDNNVTDIYIDSEETIWVGTRSGIVKLRNGFQETITRDNSDLPSNIVKRIDEDENGQIWVASLGGISKINQTSLTTFSKSNSDLPSNYISDFEFDASGNMWIATQLGLVKYNGINWQVFNTNNSSIPANFITSVLIDNSDTLWIGTNRYGSAKFDGVEKWTIYNSDMNPFGDSVSDLIIGNNNKLWLGLVPQANYGKSGGIYILEDEQLLFQNFYLSNNGINRFFKDDDNILWVGTKATGLLAIFSPTDYQLYTTNITGLPYNDIQAINKDRAGNLWIGTYGRGLVKYKIWNEL